MILAPPGPIRVLLVDDDEDDYIILRDLLNDIKDRSYNLEWVSTFDNALRTIGEKDFHVHIFDYRLAENNGLELLRRVIESGCKTPTILMTGQGDLEVDIEAAMTGAADYLIKGEFTTPMLERSIRYAMQHARTLQALRESEDRYALAARGANDGLWDWDLVTDKVFFSPRWKSMFGYADEDIGDAPEEWFSRIRIEHVNNVHQSIEEHLLGVTTHFEHEHQMVYRDGSYRWMLCRGLAVRDKNRKACRIAGSMTDITERKNVEEQLVHDAFHDGLTGLPNRALFLDRLSVALGRYRRLSESLFAVIFIDLDRFKIVNDSLGHSIGDELLIEFAGRLKAISRPGDTVARLGGDEFTILLEDIISQEGAIQFAERIHDKLRACFNLHGKEIFVSASMGIAMSAKEYERPEDILRDADTAMYRAKAMGRACHVVFDRAMHRHAVRVLDLETDLRQAILRDEFRIHYQPIISLHSRNIVGFEALLRWYHPKRGLVYPKEFIPMAEETGLIVSIGMWVLSNACKQISKLQKHLNLDQTLKISVNLSAIQFKLPDLTDLIDVTLRESELKEGSLSIEITESVIVENPSAAAAMLTKLRERGVTVHIDDFGTGYSSLSTLHRFPIDRLKIDRSFISGMGSSVENLEIVRAITTLANNLGMEVMAEGVEKKEQLEQLIALNCDYAQGFYFSKPIDLDELYELMDRNPSW